MRKRIALITSILFFSASCKEAPSEKKVETPPKVQAVDTAEEAQAAEPEEEEEAPFVLTEENAIDFFFDYQKGLKANKVKITTIQCF